MCSTVQVSGCCRQVADKGCCLAVVPKCAWYVYLGLTELVEPANKARDSKAWHPRGRPLPLMWLHGQDTRVGA